MFGFEPDPAYTLAPFHPEAVNGLIGGVRLHADGRIEAAFLPTWSARPGRPEIASAERAPAIAAYINSIGRRAGLAALVCQRRGGWYVLDPRA